VAVALSCGPGGRALDPSQKIQATNITATPGVELEMACMPTGPERCFNAIDDNCNGVIDEGCGVGTGVLQFTIAWESAADVDLIVTDPAGVKVYEGSRAAPGGLRLDKDCPSDDGCHGQNIENIFYEGLEPARGKYAVDVKLTDLRGAESPVKVRLGARVGARTFGAEVMLTPSEDRRSFGFELP
jgi:tRNA (guanosine-2'-O-)-methyltransferase